MDITVVGAELMNSRNTSITPHTILYSKSEETVLFQFKDMLVPGPAKLTINFTGTLSSDKMKGFYLSKYLLQGSQKHMAVTQFEATDARRAFPCWDEPQIKAKFDVMLVVPEGLLFSFVHCLCQTHWHTILSLWP